MNGDVGITAGKRLLVAVDRPLPNPLDYLPPPAAAGADGPADSPTSELPPIGARVRVPIGRGSGFGIVVGYNDQPPKSGIKLRAAIAAVDAEPALDASQLELLRFTAEYYQHPLGEVLFAALPKALRAGASLWPQRTWLQVTPEGSAALAAGEPARAAKQRTLLQAVGQAAQALDQLAPAARVAARALQARGWIRVEMRSAATSAIQPGGIIVGASGAGGADTSEARERESGPTLTAAQASAVAAVHEHQGSFATVLLQGATGSGKTEVYLRAIASVLEAGRNALVLVPEIGLTPQLLARFRARFAVPMAAWHSGLSDGERLAAWRLARAGVARIVIGTRSAVFAPLERLGLIVVDEEHDSSYKQHDGGCRYSARDVAVRRAQLAHCPVVLGSATPALESLHNAQQGRYRLLCLPRRADQVASPRLALIDLREHAPHEGLSTPVTQAIERHLANDGQVLVYINRRGYAPSLMCTSCGWIAPCTACDARLTVHRGAQRLRCHVCGAEHPLSTQCQRCGFLVKAVGQGTERVEETLQRMFPRAPLLRLDRDTAHSAADVEAVMNALLSGEARIVVGTQMITKGHHFPEVTLVVVLNADQGLFSTDFRASERLAQTIVQVAGRAGRAERAGEVLIQTECPEHPLLQQLLRAGYEGFADSALAERRAARWPPYTRLALLRASAAEARHAHEFLTAARQAAGRPEGVTLLGPVDATMARRADRYHAQLLVESASRQRLQRFLREWLASLPALSEARRVRWAIDVDPLDAQ